MHLKNKYFYGYNIVAAGFVIQAAYVGAMFTFGVFFKEFQAEFGWSRGAISGASSLAFLIMGITGILVGRLNDRIGPKVIIMVGGLSAGLGFLLMSRIQAPWQLYLLYGIMVGVGLSTHDVITLSTVARWFTKTRGMMTGIVKVGTGTGQLIAPLATSALIATYGWRKSTLLIGVVLVVTVVSAAQALRRDPQGMGLLPDGAKHQASDAAPPCEEHGLSLGTAARKGAFWTLSLAEFTIFFCIGTVFVHIVPHAMDLGLGPVAAAGILSTIGGVSVLGRMVLGAAYDKVGGKHSLSLCFIVLIVALLWLQMATNAWMLFFFAAVYGFAHGGFLTVMSPTVAELFGTGSHGLLFGIVLFSGTLGGAFGPIIAGTTFDRTGSYSMVFIGLTALALAGFVVTILLRRPGRETSAGSLMTSPKSMTPCDNPHKPS